jgi:hypothetical protein
MRGVMRCVPSRRRPILLTRVVGLAAFAFALSSRTGVAETCYRDQDGRIVTRRRPGFTEVECPTAESPSIPSSPPAPAPPSGTKSLGAERPPAVPATPPSEATAKPVETPPVPVANPQASDGSFVSPLPRPKLSDYAPSETYVPSLPIDDRWRIVDALGYKEHWWDPYNRNVLKGDRPIGGDWFFSLSLVSDTVVEARRLPAGVGASATLDPGALDAFGRGDQLAVVENLGVGLVLYEGDTVFKPPDYEFRFTPVFNVNYTHLQELGGVNVDPRAGTNRTDGQIGIQEAFVDKHLRNASERYDFDSLRVGIQPFSADFRGFLFQDNQLGARLFGNRSNNRFQYNLAYFRRLEKDTNSGLNDVTRRLRADDVVVANFYAQDAPILGYTSQFVVVYNRNREGDEAPYYDQNGFLERPAAFGRQASRNYDVVYLGYNGDGHWEDLNLTSSFYYALGRESTGVFVPQATEISAYFAALEASIDFDWIRPRVSGLFASGDDNPYDTKSKGFDAVFENPQFAGGETSFWIRQAVPLIGGGGVSLSSRNGILNSLRPSKDEGQSNFTNPGIMLAGLGVDMDVLPKLRCSMNANDLYFENTAVLEAARGQAGIDRHIGYDLSAALIWRPLFSQNLILRASFATLIAGRGLQQLFPEQVLYSGLLNAIVAY